MKKIFHRAEAKCKKNFLHNFLSTLKILKIFNFFNVDKKYMLKHFFALRFCTVHNFFNLIYFEFTPCSTKTQKKSCTKITVFNVTVCNSVFVNESLFSWKFFIFIIVEHFFQIAKFSKNIQLFLFIITSI